MAPLPGSIFSSWTPSPTSSASSRRRASSDPPPQEATTLGPLSSPSSPTSALDEQHLGRTLHPTFDAQHSRSTPSAADEHAPRSVSDHPPASSPTTTTTPTSSSSYRDMPFPFLRRANSVTSLPVLPPVVDSTSSLSLFPFAKSRKLLANPAAAASTSDLPSLSASPSPSFDTPTRPRSPTPLSAPPATAAAAPTRPARALERGTSAAIGPKAGARLLASKEAQRAVRDAELVAATAAVGGDELSIREQLATPGQPVGSSAERLVRRVPVPELVDGAEPQSSPSHEDATPRRRRPSLPPAADDGRRPVASAVTSKDNVVSPTRSSRRPPVAGLNSGAEPGRSTAPRQRSSSTGSTSSLSKDAVLGQLAEAVRREKKKSEMYQREFERGEQELSEIALNLDVLKEKFATSLAQQEQVIANLETEIDELESELERANDLDEEAAREYLDLLTASTSIETLKSKAPVVGAFDLDALRSSAPPGPASAGDSSAAADKPRRLPFTFRRGLSLKRRVDTHVAAYDTVASNAPLPKPPLRRASVPPPASTSTPTDSSGAIPRRPRKLSKSRTTPSIPTVGSPAAAAGFAPSGRPPLPPPAPVFPAVASPTLPTNARPRPPRVSPPRLVQPARAAPPVAGVSRSRLFGGSSRSQAQGSLTDGEREDGGVKGKADPSSPVSAGREGGTMRARKRTNSFKKGVQGTMRMLFPAHNATRAGGRASSPPGESVQQWLQRGRETQELHR
ncbi:uncharacterized protein RHOBADRAFT_55235 [Rhodotorula graminis WP1]|uniref:Uncharacterized protein n=1 Tax=Rhodotorula graminis (strain WP1) TaxID=578459 RepID=A0A0P9EIA0_RHOGW|nr:uncharacterized protein RHOBADRAFT_55235 [Rhodotorula graminis WP1]KPV72988.1 hypothetical protein RHOBADRAFT_55235 [Rhodotorula graminis WP1]